MRAGERCGGARGVAIREVRVGRAPSRLFWGHRYTLAIKFAAGR